MALAQFASVSPERIDFPCKINSKKKLNSANAGYRNYSDLGQFHLTQPLASADDADLGLNNSDILLSLIQ